MAKNTPLDRGTLYGSVRNVLVLNLLVLAAVWLIAPPAAAADATIDFETQIAPIFRQHCLRCHSADARDGDVSVATAEDVDASGAVVPGEPDASYLLELVATADGSRPEMPKDGEPLGEAEVAMLRRWIEAGAPWPKGYEIRPAVVDHQWWSLRPLTKPDVPPADIDHPIDAFLAAKQREQELRPVEKADGRALVRRVTFDLTGLPPTPEEIEAFISADRIDSEAAWAALVDRLIASPAFGEKFGRHWLDLARYAETHGYDKDKPRLNAWPYRDHVIRSFNEDKPYRRFVQEQVAGDVLFSGEPDGVLGLGFLAAGPWDFIGHWEVGEAKLDGRIAKHLDRDEMVSAVFNVFMSTTVQCAQCHHHKFDPIQMEDYYRLHAVFAAVDRADRVYDGLSPEQQHAKQTLQLELEELEAKKQDLETKLTRQVTNASAEIDQRIGQLQETYGSELRPEYGYHSQIAPQPDAVKWVQVDLGRPHRLANVLLHPAYDRYADIGAGFGFPVRYRVEASNDPGFQDDAVHVLLDASSEDQPNPKSQTIVIEGGEDAVRYLRVTATRLAERQNDFIFALGELEAFASSSGENVARQAAVAAFDTIESGVRWGTKNLTDGVFYQELTDEAALQELRQLRAKRSAIENAVYTPEAVKELEKYEQSLQSLKAKLQEFPEGRHVYAAATHFTGGGQFQPTKGQPRPIHLMHRGDLRSPGERMFPGAPQLWEDAPDAFSLPDDANAGAARAALAEYLTDHKNPLVWRSIANRLWQWCFGNPLVGTPNDFGRMGSQPTHPELLDYLAVRLRDDPEQSLKGIVRLLVTSRAYRRSSRYDADNAQVDAANQYLWRFPRRRLTAEELRDSMLAVSGTLRTNDRGGPSFQDFVIEKPEHSPHYRYDLHDPEDPATHRRSIYRFVVRSQPQPMLTTLDCADPSISVARRDESTTSLQALTQWNSRFVEVVSRKFAERIRREAPTDAEQRVDFACHIAWGRAPDATERKVLLELVRSQNEATLARVLINTSAFTYVD